MAKFLRFTVEKDVPIIINVDSIKYIQPSWMKCANETVICTGKEEFLVNGSFEEILASIPYEYLEVYKIDT